MSDDTIAITHQGYSMLLSHSGQRIAKLEARLARYKACLHKFYTWDTKRGAATVAERRPRAGKGETLDTWCTRTHRRRCASRCPHRNAVRHLRLPDACYPCP